MSLEQRYLRVVAGEAGGPAAAAARAGLSLLSPAYSAVVRGRNTAFDFGLKRSRHLQRATLSVGNLTVGGTGKTPVVAHLARRLLDRGRRPAVLLRGYRSRPGEKGDEQRLLEDLLGQAVPVAADPDRAAAAGRVLASRPEVDVFLLDDGFQHRRVARDFDLVLVDATRPFGLGRVLPRGLLREPVRGLRRASAVLLTRCDHADEPQLSRIEATVRRDCDAPIYRSRFEAGDLLDAAGNAVADVVGRRVMGVCGLGNPAAFFSDLRKRGLDVVAEQRYGDHHHYTAADATVIAAAAKDSNAEAVVTSGKDWVKLRHAWPAAATIWVTSQRCVFADAAAEQAVLAQIGEAIGRG